MATTGERKDYENLKRWTFTWFTSSLCLFLLTALSFWKISNLEETRKKDIEKIIKQQKIITNQQIEINKLKADNKIYLSQIEILEADKFVTELNQNYKILKIKQKRQKNLKKLLDYIDLYSSKARENSTSSSYNLTLKDLIIDSYKNNEEFRNYVINYFSSSFLQYLPQIPKK